MWQPALGTLKLKTMHKPFFSHPSLRASGVNNLLLNNAARDEKWNIKYVKNFNNSSMFEATADKRRLLICKYYEPFKLLRRIRQGKSAKQRNGGKICFMYLKVKCVRFWNWLNWNVHFGLELRECIESVEDLKEIARKSLVKLSRREEKQKGP